MKMEKGFTLVELLVVISIIALLLSILMPALGKVRKQAQAIFCASNTRQAGISFQAYATENNGYLPYTANYFYSVGSQSSGTVDFSYAWFSKILPYLSTDLRYDNSLTNPQKFPRLKIYECPSRKQKIENTNIKIRALDYAVNYGGQTGLFPQSNWPIVGVPPSTWGKGRSQNPSMNLSRVRSPSQVMALMDSTPQPYGTGKFCSRMWIYSAYPMPDSPDKNSWWWTIDYDWDGDGKNDSSRAVLNQEGVQFNGVGVRHPEAIAGKKAGKTNVAFADGHSAPVSSSEFQFERYWIWH